MQIAGQNNSYFYFYVSRTKFVLHISVCILRRTKKTNTSFSAVHYQKINNNDHLMQLHVFKIYIGVEVNLYVIVHLSYLIRYKQCINKLNPL